MEYGLCSTPLVSTGCWRGQLGLGQPPVTCDVMSAKSVCPVAVREHGLMLCLCLFFFSSLCSVSVKRRSGRRSGGPRTERSTTGSCPPKAAKPSADRAKAVSSPSQQPTNRFDVLMEDQSGGSPGGQADDTDSDARSTRPNSKSNAKNGNNNWQSVESGGKKKRTRKR